MFQVFPSQWLSLDQSVRTVLARKLDIKPTGRREVKAENGVHKIVSDGFTTLDLMKITIPAMQKYVSNSTLQDGSLLWDLTVKKATGEPVTTEATEPEPEAKKKLGRPPKV